MMGCILSKVTDITYLGITISENLQWEKQIAGITTKASRSLGFLRRNLRSCPKQLRQLAYFSIVRSRLEYGAAIWDPYLAKDTKQVEVIQRKAARFVMQDHKRTSSVTGMIKTLEWDSLETRRSNSRLTLLKKIVSGKVHIQADDYLTKADSRTRSVNTDKFKVFSTKTAVYKNSFFPPAYNPSVEQNTRQYASRFTHPIRHAICVGKPP